MRAFMPEVASEMLGYLIERLMNLSLEINLIFSISHQIYVPLISNRGCQRTLLNYIICPAKLQSTGRFVIFGYNRVD